MEYVDLKGFAGFIKERNLVEESRRSYYLNWVRRFLTSEFSSSELATRDKVECFAELGRQNRLENWQFWQVVDAMRLLVEDLAGHVPKGSGRFFRHFFVFKKLCF